MKTEDNQNSEESKGDGIEIDRELVASLLTANLRPNTGLSDNIERIEVKATESLDENNPVHLVQSWSVTNKTIKVAPVLPFLNDPSEPSSTGTGDKRPRFS